MGKVTYPTGTKMLPSKDPRGLSYFVKSSGLSPNPLYKSGYIISALLS